MTAISHARSFRRDAGVILATLILVLAALVLSATPAHAASRVDVSPAPNADGSTTVTLTGTGFQYVPNAPGGVYVFFGTVATPSTNAWAPSQGGRSGETFSYDGSSTLLVAFEGGSSADAANAVIRPDGTWTAQMTLPGATFTSSYGDPHSGAAQTGAQIDCLRVMCGIITIGAHGTVNANNESFTPFGFVTAGGDVVTGQEVTSFDDDATVVDIPGADESETASPEATNATEQPTPVVPLADAGTDADADGASAGPDTMTYIVFGVLGIAVLALIVALVVFFRRRPAPEGASTAADGVSETDAAVNGTDGKESGS